MKQHRTYKMRLYPLLTQEEELKKILKTYDLTLQCFQKMNEKNKEKYGKSLSIYEMKHALLKVKNKYPVLQKTPQLVLENAIKKVYLDEKKAKGTLVSEKETTEITCYDGFSLDFSAKKVKIPGMTSISFRDKRNLSSVSLLTIKQYQNKWYMLLSSTIDIPNQKNTETLRYVGIDVGLKEFAILSSGLIVPNPRFFRTWEEKLGIEQRKLARKQKDSANYKKQQQKVRKIYQKIAQLRLNFLHKVSSTIVKEYDVIGIEKLEIQKMIKNKQFSKSILDASWGEFLSMLKYKAAAQNKTVIEVGRFYPSSQLCSNCGAKQLMPLHLRTYTCGNCHTKIDRDYNASKNIETLAKKIYDKRP